MQSGFVISESTCMNVFAIPILVNPAKINPFIIWILRVPELHLMSAANPSRCEEVLEPPTFLLCSVVLNPELIP